MLTYIVQRLLVEGKQLKAESLGEFAAAKFKSLIEQFEEDYLSTYAVSAEDQATGSYVLSVEFREMVWNSIPCLEYIRSYTDASVLRASDAVLLQERVQELLETRTHMCVDQHPAKTYR